MSDKLIIDTRSPGTENITHQSPKHDRWAFLSYFKSKIGRIRRVKPKPDETSQVIINFSVGEKTSNAISDASITTQEECWKEDTRVEIPRPGTAPIPEGSIRLFHFTYPDRLESIRKEGLTRKGHEITSDAGLNVAPNSTWVYSDLNLKEPPIWTIGLPYFEFSAPLDDVGFHNTVAKEGTARTLKPGIDVLPDKIIAIHEPWHEMIRHSNNGVVDPEWLKNYIDTSVRNAGNRGTRGNYTNYTQMLQQQQYLGSQLVEANRYLSSS